MREKDISWPQRVSVSRCRDIDEAISRLVSHGLPAQTQDGLGLVYQHIDAFTIVPDGDGFRLIVLSHEKPC
jgi:hypothetical protein